MAAITPTQVFPNYIFNENNVTIPIASLPALNEAEANATTGDGRELIRAIVVQAHAAITAMSAENKPSKMTVALGNAVGLSPTTIRRTYTFTFDENVTPITTTLAAE